MDSGLKADVYKELCETCIERCPMDALQMGNDDLPQLDLNQCIGCGVCAAGCPETAIMMNQRQGMPVPPFDRMYHQHKRLIRPQRSARYLIQLWCLRF